MRFSRPRISRRSFALLAAGLLVLLGVAGVRAAVPAGNSRVLLPTELASMAGDETQQIPGGLDGGVDWINTRGPIRLQDLRGKVVLLDFWTYCCINCHHVLPDLEYLEAKYPDELVVIGVHSPKFDAEKLTENIKKKVAEYRIKHPVVNDANMTIWNRFSVQSWPTLVVINARGEYVGAAPGEGNREVLDRVIGKLVQEHRAAGELSTMPIKFFPESERPHDGPLLYPGKIVADPAGGRLFITDTGHNRIVVTDLNGAGLHIVGSGAAGLKDGSFAEAEFNRPQGTCLVDGKLYVADVENHAIRVVDFDTQTVATVAGTGEQSNQRFVRQALGKAIETGLNSPWDLARVAEKRLAVAMAGPHQIWILDLEANTVYPWAGSGREDILDGPISGSGFPPLKPGQQGLAATEAAFAQPSGLASDGKFLYVADSEGSCVRQINLEGKPEARTIAGTHDLPMGQSLFAFGDRDGKGTQARFQHCLGLALGQGKLFVADSYNNKIKVIQLESRQVETLAGTRTAGSTDNPPQFYEPGGLSLVDSTLYVADTNNHAIRVVDINTGKVNTLALSGVEAPRPKRSRPRFPNAMLVEVPEVLVAPADRFLLSVTLALPEGFELNPEPLPYLLESPGNTGLLASSVSPYGAEIDPPKTEFEIEVPLARRPRPDETLTVNLSLSSFECKKDGAGYCRVRSFIWAIPVRFDPAGTSRVELNTNNAKPVPRPRVRN